MFILILNNVLVLTSIGATLAVLLVVADYFLANYGECKIDINKGKKQMTVQGGNSLLNSLADNNLYLSSACGGKGTCGLCKATIHNGAGPVLPTEKPYLDDEELEKGVRLSCQVKVKTDMEIEIPAYLFSIRKYKTKVIDIIDYTLQEPDSIEFKAGQYVQLESKKYPKAKQPVIRAYSVASSPQNKNEVELIIRKVPDGIMTTFTHEYLQKGDEISFTGPYGDFYIRDTDNDMIFVAGGSGMAPFKSILEDLAVKDCKRRIVYFFGARTVKDLFLTDEMKVYEKKLADFQFIPVLSQPEEGSEWKGLTGYIPQYFEEYIDDANKTEGYFCGSPGLLNSAEKKMKELGVTEIFYDSFG